MYRISQAAEMLHVSTAIVRSVLIEFHEELLPHTIVEHGISMIDEKGIRFLRGIIEGGTASRDSSNVMRVDPSHEIICKDHEQSSKRSLEEQLLTYKRLMNEKKNELHRITMDCRKLDEAIEHYLEILKEDMNERIRIEDLLDGESRDLTESGIDGHQVVMFDK